MAEGRGGFRGGNKCSTGGTIGWIVGNGSGGEAPTGDLGAKTTGEGGQEMSLVPTGETGEMGGQTFESTAGRLEVSDRTGEAARSGPVRELGGATSLVSGKL